MSFILKRTRIGKLLASFAMMLLLAGVYQSQSAPMSDQPLFQGITYTKVTKTVPVKQVVHIAKIDLTADGLSFLVTPSGDIEDFDFAAQTVSQFLDTYDLQLAINGDYFDPWYDYSIFYYYPHVGDGVSTSGLSASQGIITTEGSLPSHSYKTLYISHDNQASFGEPVGEIYNAISGNLALVNNGRAIDYGGDDYFQTHQPRTAVGLTQDAQTLIIVVVDGRREKYSEGATFAELSQLLLDAGAYHAINLDGGGSSTLVIDDNGEPKVISSPIHGAVPDRERPIANQLGIYANPLP